MSRFVDTITGEILSRREISQKYKSHTVHSYVGIETKFPSDCLTKEHLLESLSAIDAYLSKSSKVNYAALLKSVNLSIISNKESNVIAFLSENITAWNYYIGRVSDLDHIVGDSKNLAKLVKGLVEKGIIRIEHRGFFYKDSVVIKVSPFYVWKGNLAFRPQAVNRWYTSCSDID